MLRHSTDSKPGITREKNGLDWAYFAPDGKRIADRDEIDRLNAIALPRLGRASAGDRARCARAQAISLSRGIPRPARQGDFTAKSFRTWAASVIAFLKKQPRRRKADKSAKA